MNGKLIFVYWKMFLLLPGKLISWALDILG